MEKTKRISRRNVVIRDGDKSWVTDLEWRIKPTGEWSITSLRGPGQERIPKGELERFKLALVRLNPGMPEGTPVAYAREWKSGRWVDCSTRLLANRHDAVS